MAKMNDEFLALFRDAVAKIDVINEKLDVLLIWQAKHDTEADARQAAISRLDKQINGNGIPGIKSHVERLLHDFETADKSTSRSRGIWDNLIVAVGSAGIVAVGAWVLHVFKVIA